VVRRRHACFFLAWAQRGRTKLRGPNQRLWLARLEREHDNLWAALEWVLADPGGAELGLRLAAALAPFWSIRGYFTEGREWLARTLERSGGTPAPLHAEALLCAGALAPNHGDYAIARALCKASLALFRELGDQQNMAWSLAILGHTAEWQSDYTAARSFLEESLPLLREVNDTWRMAAVVSRMVFAASHQGDLAAARAVRGKPGGRPGIGR
jgi:non-specific serine/threonine protein kinase